MANVKHTTNDGEILTTSCKKLSTALRRFTAFLKEYDVYYNEMLSEINSEKTNVTRDTCETETVTISLANDTGTYTLTIKHNVKIPNTTESETAEQTEAEHAEAEQAEAETTVQKTPSNMKNDINKKFGVNCIYHDTDSIMCDNTIQIVNTHKDYILRAYKNGKEINVPCSRFNKREYAIDYINKLCENCVVSRDVVFTINNRDIYDCFSDVKMSGTTAQIKYAADMLNAFYKQLCVDIALEYKMRIFDDIDIGDKGYYANLGTYVTTLKKVLNGNCVKAVIKNRDKFEIWGNVYRTAMNFILAYNENEQKWIIKHLESKIRRELIGYGETK